MAQIDLRHAIIRIKDGYAGPGGAGAINEPGGYALGVGTMTVDGFTGAVANSNHFQITGDTTDYVISAHTETLGNTTSITFSPVLAASVLDNAVITVDTFATDDTGAINNGPGYVGGTVTMTVDGFTTALTTTHKFKIAGQNTLYTISSHTETLSNTTSITFTPGLTASVADNAVITVSTLTTVNTGAVNQAPGYVIGDTVLAVDGYTAAVVTGDLVTIGADMTQYEITAHSETLSATKQITIFPALVANAADNAVIVGLPHQIEINIGDGNLTYDEKRSIKYIRNRNVLDTVRLDQDEPMEVKLDALWEFVRADTNEVPTIEDAVKQRGVASDWITSAADTCEPYAVDIEIEYDPPCTGVKREFILLTDFRYESFSHDLKMGVFAVTGKCNVTEATVSRVM